MTKKTRKNYAKRSENITRNQMIAKMWQDHPEKTMQQIADTFNVSYVTVNRCIHRYLEFDDPIYTMLLAANNTLPNPYTQATITRAWMALRRWYPEIRTTEQLKILGVGTGIDNLPPMSAACENLIERARELLGEHPHLQVI